MHQQVGWRGLMERLKEEAPRYAQILPELPRLMHQRLSEPLRTFDRDSAALIALVSEVRKTNRLLQGLIWGGLGFVLGALVVQVLLRTQGA
jgi:ubiquinone biosynthesis protein